MKTRLDIVVISVACSAAAFSADAAPAPPAHQEPGGGDASTRRGSLWELFRDPEDGAFDASGFLSSATGFLPVLVPITEPAVGYGLGAALAFFHGTPRVVADADGEAVRVVPPSISTAFGMATENGSWAAGAGHLQVWDEGRVRYLVGAGYASMNLDWYGQGDAFDGRARPYNSESFGFVQKLTFQIGDTPWFLGPTQRLRLTDVTFDRPGPDLGIRPDEADTTLSGLGVVLSYDTRDSLFSPRNGTKASIGYTYHTDAIGSDFDYGKLDAEVCHYIPLGEPFTLGLRGQADFASDEAPFFDLPSVSLRGIPAGRYADNAALTLEAELRWDVTKRWSLVSFGGVGWAADGFGEIDNVEANPAGGAGVRYLLARQYDLRMGADLAFGPEDAVFYITVGTGWFRD